MRWEPARELGGEFWTFFVAALCFDLGFSMYLFLYSLFLLDIGFNERQLGLVAGAMTIGGMIGTLPVGALAQRFGPRRVLLAGFMLTPAVCALRPFFPGEHAQIALALLTGLVMCHWAVCFSPATAALTTEKSRTFAFSLLFSTGIGTGGLGGLMGGWLPGWIERMHAATGPADAKRMVLLLCCAIYALGVWPVLRLKLRAAKTQQGGPWTFHPFLYRYLPAIALWSLAAGAFVPFAQAFLARQAHLSLAHIGAAFSAAQMAQVAAILLAPIVFRRFGLVAGIAYTQAAAAFALAGLACARHVPLAVTMYVAFMALHWMGGPGIYSLLMGRVPETARSTASAANSFTTSLCQAIAAAAAGAAYVAFGYPAVLAVVAAIALLASLLFWTLLREDHRGRLAVAAQAEC